MDKFTANERNLMCIYDTGTREGLIKQLRQMRGFLEADQPELMEMTDSALEKLEKMTDAEYAALDLTPDFDL